MPSALEAMKAANSAPGCSVQILLLTYRASVLADDIFQSAAGLALCRPGVQVVVAWGGQEGPRLEQWRHDVAQYQALGADVVLVVHASGLERTRQALAMPKAWVLPLADDDPMAVNYLRAMVDATLHADHDISALLPSNQVQNGDTQTISRRNAGWLQPDADTRLLDMLAHPAQQGTLFWAMYRHAVVKEWLAFALQLPFQPSYLDQFLPHLAACHGRIAIAPEETILLKDERNWQGEAAGTRTNARYYPQPEMALYHEWLWAADLWKMLGQRTADTRVQLALKAWARHMIGHMFDVFDTRRQLLGLQLSASHIQTLETLRAPCQWLLGPDLAEDVADGMSQLAALAHAARTEWLATTQRPAPKTSASPVSVKLALEHA